MKEDPNERREREFDAITFVLAAVLSVIAGGAVGYGILKSSKVATIVPPPALGLQIPVQAQRPPADPNTTTTGSR
jgi:hypothetical protein